MTNPDDNYEIDNFISSNTGCAITHLTIEPVIGGTSSDFTIPGASTQITITSSLSDPKITVQLPPIVALDQTLKFRIKAIAKGD